MENIQRVSRIILDHFAKKYNPNIGFSVDTVYLADLLHVDLNDLLESLEGLRKHGFIETDKTDPKLWIIILLQKGYNAGMEKDL